MGVTCIHDCRVELALCQVAPIDFLGANGIHPAMTEKYPSQLAERFQIRLPDGMRDRIKKLAAENGRSMNSQIVQMLEYAIDDLDVAAHTYSRGNKAEATRDYLREEVRRARSILSHILADYEDPESEISKIVAEREAQDEDGG